MNKENDIFLAGFPLSNIALYPELDFSVVFQKYPIYVEEDDWPHLKDHYPTKEDL